METNSKLGKDIHKLLLGKGIETPMCSNKVSGSAGGKIDYIQNAVRNILGVLNMDLEDDSLKETPHRVAKMYCEEIFGGLNYDNFPKCTIIENKMGYDEIVLVRNIIVRSTCEHHLQPIYGRAHLAYIPNRRVLGLSKFERVLDFFASRPQVQERLSEQVFASLSHILETEDVAVIIEAEHFCMKMRGVEDSCSDTVTSKMGGRFRTVPEARAELMLLINHNGHGRK